MNKIFIIARIITYLHFYIVSFFRFFSTTVHAKIIKNGTIFVYPRFADCTTQPFTPFFVSLQSSSHSLHESNDPFLFSFFFFFKRASSSPSSKIMSCSDSEELKSSFFFKVFFFSFALGIKFMLFLQLLFSFLF